MKELANKLDDNTESDLSLKKKIKLEGEKISKSEVLEKIKGGDLVSPPPRKEKVEPLEKGDNSTVNTVNTPNEAVSSRKIMTDSQMIELISTYPVDKMPSNRVPIFCDADIKQIYEQTALINGISFRSAAVGIHQLLRKGAANSEAPMSLGVEVYCPDTERRVLLTKSELFILLSKNNKYKDDKNVCRTFAESVAVVACTAAQNQIESKKVPIELLAGDLFGKINRGLVANKEPRLSPREAVWCCSYCQKVNDLNSLSGSDRLEQLLTKDLQQRLDKKRAASSPLRSGKQSSVNNKEIKRGMSPQKAKKLGSDPRALQNRGPNTKGNYKDTTKAKEISASEEAWENI